ncbi:MAG: hypothetical protein CMF62_00075 [Magnetococcales bacterium]|nr:hypothetical protein [Magnetococcales bacterium]|tara:strand:+ start:849 stop:1289 length:441 start_codon:yes stop_codon:yes gene_type:complete
MDKKIKILLDNLDKEKNNFLILSNRIPETYTQYRINPIDEYKQQFRSLQDQINKSFSQLFILKNQILNLSEEMSFDMYEKDQYISYAEEATKEKNNFLKHIKGKESASIPRENDIEKTYNVELTLLGIQTVFFIGYGYLIYHLIKN